MTESRTRATEVERRELLDASVERARMLLVRGELPASQVALEAGFAHQSHTARCMRRVLGVRLETTATSPQTRRIDLKGLVADIVADAQWEARERECRVDLVCNGDCMIEANPDLLRSAAENIIRNAVRYTAPGTAVEVHVACRDGGHGDAVTIRVSDRGPGVPNAELSNICRPLYRVAGARDRESGGVGLGLAIAQRVARVHGGSIHADNRAGGGLEVVCSLN